MKELHRDQLQAAIDQLPTYRPEADVWDRLETELDADLLSETYTEHHPEQLRLAVDRLPQYSAPQQLWRNIEKRLSPSLVRRTWFARMAASLLLFALVGGTAWWLLSDSKPELPPKISEQVTPNPSISLPQAQALSPSLIQQYEPDLADCWARYSASKTVDVGHLMGILVVIDSLNKAGISPGETLLAAEKESADSLRKQICP